MGNVELPPWASDAQDFVAQMAEALESPHVSRSLHRWIDLIFGCCNQGPAALAADNVFHHLTYDNMCVPLYLCCERSARLRPIQAHYVHERLPIMLYTCTMPHRHICPTSCSWVEHDRLGSAQLTVVEN